MRPLKFRHGLDEFILVRRRQIVRIQDEEAALRVLQRQVDEDIATPSELRRAANSFGWTGGERDSLAFIAKALAHGDLLLVRIDEQLPPLQRPDPVWLTPRDGPNEPIIPIREPTYLALTVVHENGGLFPGAKFGVQLPDGSLARGTLGGGSSARFDDVAEPGTCWVRFEPAALLLSDQERARPSGPVFKAQPGDVTVESGSTSSLRLRTGAEQRIVVKRPTAHVLETAEVCFGLDRCVLLPDAVPRPDPEPGPGVVDGLTVAAAAFRFIEAHPDKRRLVVGHTDASGSRSHNEALSEDRSRSVMLYLAGRHDEWGAHAASKHEVFDLQRILAWITRTEPNLDCNPGAVDGDFGPLTTEALRQFRSNANALLGTSLPIDGPPTAGDFAAFATVYDLDLQRRLELDEQSLRNARDRLRFVPPEALGLGEAYARAHENAGDAERAQDRRVELMFFDPIEAERIAGADIGKLLYGPSPYFRQVELLATPRLQADQIGLLIVDTEDKPFPNVRYRLTFPDGRIAEGTSDDQGFAHVGSLPSGTCLLELPDVDASDWEAEAAGPRPLPAADIDEPDEPDDEPDEPPAPPFDPSVFDDDPDEEDR